MHTILEIIKLSSSGILVLLMAYFLLDKFFKNQERKRYMEVKLQAAKALDPVRLTAYERLALLLERINPDSLVVRVQMPGMSAKTLHMALITTVREEFDHNVTQQIYVSADLWLLIKAAKENLLQVINTIASQMPDDIPAIELGKVIIEKYNETETATPIETALEGLKREVRSFS
ncbi:MAG: hypothetical protein MJZ24_00330 [Paludibacteraceae bacterium]|nr:hypothetical protein [Candidatus Physcocola equi]MCQ2233170.1 hypothetical protein [Paludibacteraceae bacterium]